MVSPKIGEKAKGNQRGNQVANWYLLYKLFLNVFAFFFYLNIYIGGFLTVLPSFFMQKFSHKEVDSYIFRWSFRKDIYEKRIAKIGLANTIRSNSRNRRCSWGGWI